jgi:hypothetical protein
MTLKKILCIILFGILANLVYAQQNYLSRQHAIDYIELRISEILPWNWHLVKTDTSVTVYFCRTAFGENGSQRNKNLLVNDSSIYGKEFYNQPVPDSIYLSKPYLLHRCTYPKLDTNEFKTQKLNDILMIRISLDTIGTMNNKSKFYNYYVTFEPSISCTDDIFYREKLTPQLPYYSTELGKELRREYWYTFKSIKYLMGFNSEVNSLGGY